MCLRITALGNMDWLQAASPITAMSSFVCLLVDSRAQASIGLDLIARGLELVNTFYYGLFSRLISPSLSFLSFALINLEYWVMR